MHRGAAGVNKFIIRFLVVLIGLLACNGLKSFAHESRPAYLEINEVSNQSYDVLWKLPRRADKRLNLSPVLPNAFERTVPSRQLVREAFIERWSFSGDVPLSGQMIRIDGLERTFTDVLVRIKWLDGRESTTRLTPHSPSFVVPITPSKWQVSWTYLIIGVEHIILGLDHLLFVLSLALIVEGQWKLVKTITAFTLAHSITLAIATLGWLHVPGPPVEAIIALSIVFVATEILKKGNGEPSLTERRPWIVALTFGLLHGFGFAGALAEVGLPVGDIPMALMTFNIGVELGQLLFLSAVLSAGQLLRAIPIKWPAFTPKVVPYAVGTLAAYWTIDRIIGFCAFV